MHLFISHVNPCARPQVMVQDVAQAAGITEEDRSRGVLLMTVLI